MVALLAAMGTTGLIAGCGGSEDDSNAMNASSSAPIGWVQQANQLCRDAEARYQKLPNVYISSYDEVVSVIARNERELAADLRSVKVPKEDVGSLRQLVDLLNRQSHEAAEANRIYSHLGGEGTYEEYKQHVERASKLNDPIGRAARALGVSACAHPPLRTKYL